MCEYFFADTPDLLRGSEEILQDVSGGVLEECIESRRCQAQYSFP